MNRETPEREQPERAQNDPGESNNPQSNAAGFDMHIWSSLNQIFERIGKIDQKIDQISHDQGKLKDSVEKHDKLVLRVGYTIAGAVAIIGVLWFIYENLLKGHVLFK